MNKQEWSNKERIVFEKFKTGLSKVKTFPEALILVKQLPPIDSPGRVYYTRLSIFLDGFHVPGGLSDDEKILYEKFIEQLVSNGQLEPGEGQKIKNKPSLDNSLLY